MNDLKTKYKYIEFKERPHKEAELWICLNKKDGTHLADLIYYKPWRQWVVEFQEGCVFNNTCLNDISHFLRQINQIPARTKSPRITAEAAKGDRTLFEG